MRTTVADVIAARAGVCQDFAHVLIALARSRGIPARYASGYIFRGVAGALGADASHAWAEAYLPPFGWVGRSRLRRLIPRYAASSAETTSTERYVVNRPIYGATKQPDVGVTSAKSRPAATNT